MDNFPHQQKFKNKNRKTKKNIYLETAIIINYRLKLEWRFKCWSKNKFQRNNKYQQRIPKPYHILWVIENEFTCGSSILRICLSQSVLFGFEYDIQLVWTEMFITKRQMTDSSGGD